MIDCLDGFYLPELKNSNALEFDGDGLINFVKNISGVEVALVSEK